MQTITLYKYTRPGGGITVSPIMPDCTYTTLSRLIADDGMMLTDGTQSCYCTDTDSPEQWSETAKSEVEV